MARTTTLSFKNPDTYEKIFRKYYKWLCNYILSLSGDPDLAEDIVQEVFIKLWESRNDISINTSVKYYLLKACHRGFLQHTREVKQENNLLKTLKWDTLYDLHSEDQKSMTTKIQAVHRAIEQLPPQCKEAFLLSRYNRLKYKEIAEEMGISIKTVEIHISKALSLLRQNISFPLHLIVFLLMSS